MAPEYSRLYSTETLNIFTVQKISKERTTLVETANIASLVNLVSLDILFHAD